jgi:hypothetical protein
MKKILACWTVRTFCILLLFGLAAQSSQAQQPPYDVFPDAKPPYYRVRYEASDKAGELIFSVNYTVWIPSEVRQLRGVIVHQHGCGEGSCKSGLTGAYDLQWQALAAKHHCALLAPAYEQPQQADCQMWCDPRNGSAQKFQQCLVDLGNMSGHAELSEVPWALWGHSGGGHWAGGMTLMFPQRVIASWLRSGVPLLSEDSSRPNIKPHSVSADVFQVPICCNFGTKEGYSVKDGQFAGVWPSNETFFQAIRAQGGLISLAIDPKSSHECGNQRYLAIPWLDACLQLRLPKAGSSTLQAAASDSAWLADHETLVTASMKNYQGDVAKASWLPDESVAKAWREYSTDTEVTDTTPPPVPSDVRVDGKMLRWSCAADLESGIAKFMIYRNGELIGSVAGQENKHGRAVFQGLAYSDTPLQPLQEMSLDISKHQPDQPATYRVTSINTTGLSSP